MKGVYAQSIITVLSIQYNMRKNIYLSIVIITLLMSFLYVERPRAIDIDHAPLIYTGLWMVYLYVLHESKIIDVVSKKLYKKSHEVSWYLLASSIFFACYLAGIAIFDNENAYLINALVMVLGSAILLFIKILIDKLKNDNVTFIYYFVVFFGSLLVIYNVILFGFIIY